MPESVGSYMGEDGLHVLWGGGLGLRWPVGVGGFWGLRFWSCSRDLWGGGVVWVSGGEVVWGMFLWWEVNATRSDIIVKSSVARLRTAGAVRVAPWADRIIILLVLELSSAWRSEVTYVVREVSQLVR